MTDAPDLDPLAENIEGHVVESHNFEHRLNHEIPWGHVALGVGLVALAYVAYQALNESNDEAADEVPEETAPQPGGDLVDIEVGGGWSP